MFPTITFSLHETGQNTFQNLQSLIGLNQIYQTISIDPKKQIYQAKCLKCNEPNIPNQIYSIKPTKLKSTNQFYQTKSRETKSAEKGIPG